jgi:biuret amidohydrolase
VWPISPDYAYGLGLTLQAEYPEVASYYFKRLKEIVIPNHIRLIKFFRHHKLKVIYLTVGPVLPDGSDELLLTKLRKKAVRKSLRFHQGTFEHGILEEIKPQAGELVINKTSSDAF